MTFITEKLSFFLILFVILLSPYYRGIYPDYYKLPFLTLIFLAFLIFLLSLLRKKEKYFTINLPEVSFFLLVIVYFFTIIIASNKLSASITFLSYTAWAFLFWLIFKLFQNNFLKKLLVQLIVWNAGILSIIGFLGSLQLIPDRFQNFLGMSFWGLYFYGRVSTTFQYQNTSASFYAGCLFLGIYLYRQETTLWKKLIHGSLSYLIFSGFLFAFSRGANLTLIISIIFLFILLKKKLKIAITSLSFAILILPFILFQNHLDQYLSQALLSYFLGLLIIGLLIFLFLTVLFFHPKNRIAQNILTKKNSWIIILMVILSIEFLFLFFIQLNSSYFISIRNFGEKGREISFETKNATDRLTFYRDALKMIQKKPLLGWGGGGWAARYFSFQSHTYYTKFPHSFYLNTLVESGVLGLVPLLFLLFYSLRICIISANQDHGISIIPYLGTGVFLIFLHSSIDLNFAMGAYHIFAWTLLALLLSHYPLQKLKLSIPLIIPGIISLLFFVISIFWGNAEYYYQLGREFRGSNDLTHSAKAWETTVQLNPWHDSAFYQMSNLSSDIYLQTKKEEFLQLALEKNQKALDIEPYNYEYYRQKADLLLLKGELDEAWGDYGYSMELAPMVSGNYEKILFAFLNKLNSQQKSMDPKIFNQIKVYTDLVYNLYIENQSKSTQPNPPSETLNFLKMDIDKVVGGGNAEDSITED